MTTASVLLFKHVLDKKVQDSQKEVMYFCIISSAFGDSGQVCCIPVNISDLITIITFQFVVAGK